MIDLTVNLGNLIEFAGFVVGGLIVIGSMRGDLRTLKEAVAMMQVEIKKISDILVAQGRLDERITALSERVYNVERRTNTK